MPSQAGPVHDPGPSLACRAPFTSLHIDQFGDARPCCQSSRVLGNVADQAIEEIWHGEPLAELRAAIERDDLSLGCEHCEWAGRSGRDTTYAVRFDRDRIPAPEAGPVRLELAPSNSCNLQCAMCNGDWSSSIRLSREGRPALPRRFGEAQVAEVEALAAGLDEIQLFGGEPFLMPEALRVLEIAAAHDITCVITTNGSILTPRVERVIDRPGVHLVVSIDGTTEAVYESIRAGASWATLNEHLDAFQAIAARHGNSVDVAHCLMTANWHEFADHLTWAHARALPVYVNDVLSPVEMSLHHLTPPELGEVVRRMRAREPEIASLPDAWRSTWEQAVGRLEQTLQDGAEGSRHEHLGQLTAGAVEAMEPSEAKPLARRMRALYLEPRARIDLDLDARLIVVGIRASGTTDRLPLGDLERVIGQPTAQVTTLLEVDDPLPPALTLRWDRSIAAHERTHDLDGGACAERRTTWADDGGVTLAFEYWLPPEERDQADLVRSVSREGRVVEFVLDRTGALASIEPAALAVELGLRTDLGIRCASPAEMLDVARADPPPAFTIEDVELGIVAVDLEWADGYHLTGLAHATPDRTVVRLGEADPESTDGAPHPPLPGS
jgi:MoaA/NifB/PqqE/SkfB family radical SAM enzyme